MPQARIGIDLTTGYGVAAIRYSNNTIIDVAKVDGDVVYLSSLKYLVDDAMEVAKGNPSKLEIVPSFAQFPKRDPQIGLLGLRKDSTVCEILERIVYGRYIKLEYSSIPTEVLKPDLSALAPKTQKIITAISEMMAKLVSKVRELEPLNNVAVAVCVPDILHGHSEYFRAAGLEAGLAIILSTRGVSTDFYQSEGQWIVEAYKSARKSNWDSGEYDFKRSDNYNEILSIYYSKEALGVTWGIIDRGLERVDLHKGGVYYDLGHATFLRSKQRNEYRDAVKSTLANMVEPAALKDVPTIQLLGDAALEPELISLLNEIFKDNPCLKKGRYLLAPQAHIFGAARGRAHSARFWMRTGDEAFR
ncbi:hypothetical protein TWF173_010327 [Orbilia oligospora]|nr:hypothetical protein TWF173_010327 [Orbilia oligospora]